MEQKSKFDKVMGAWDILVIAFGAMIGWGWVINSGDWITTAGFAGSMIAMLIGGLMVFFVGLTYAELTSAMPQCGGEHVFSYRARPFGTACRRRSLRSPNSLREFKSHTSHFFINKKTP